MPMVIALVGAAGSIMAGAAAVEAGSAFVGGLMIAGGVASGLGAITGNKTLQQIGMVAGLAGGVAGFATDAWNSTASDLAQFSSDVTNPSSAGAVNGMDLASDQATAASNQAATSAVTNGTEPSVAAELAKGGSTDGVISGNAQNLAQNQATTPFGQSSMADQLGAGAPDVNVPTATSDMTSGPNAVATTANGSNPVPASGAGFQNAQSPSTSNFTAAQPTQQSGSGSLWDTMKKLPSWIQSNPELAKLGGGILNGAMTSYGQQSLLKQKMQLQDEYNQLQRQRQSNSVIGLYMPTYQAPAPK